MSQNIKFIVLVAIINIINFNQIDCQNFNSIDIEFLKDNVVQENMLAGGLIAPQFSSIDMNGDGVEDLFVFDRAGNVVLTFINRGVEGVADYYYDPSYQELFPKLNEFATLMDYNGDGLKDIFALSSQGVGGVEVWKNVGTAAVPSFEMVRFDQYDFDILYYRASGDFYTNLYVSNIDFPAIVDVDDDGDLDIITFENEGSHIQLYKNMVKEWNLPADTLVYDLVDKCYGLVYEGEFSEEISLSTDGSTCPNELVGETTIETRHAGSSLMAFDENGDGALDLLIGDLSNENMVLLVNGGTSEDAWFIDQDIAFPSYDEEVHINTFVGSFLIDVDNDGKKDLIAAPNYDLGSNNKDHIWYYKNVSNTDAYVFELQQKDFLVDKSITMGGFSNPCFLDYNGDGLKDLLIGTNGIYDLGEKKNGMYLYENIGTASVPRYQLVDDDFLDLGELVSESTRLAPASGDLDGDGDEDLIIGNSLGFLFYFENIAGEGNPAEYANYVYKYMGVRPGLNANPQIFDLDDDGLKDLILGEKNDNIDEETMVLGGVSFFRNIGSKLDPLFNSDVNSGVNTSVLGGIYTRDIGETSTGESDPFFIYTDNHIKAVVGSKSGRVRLYDNITNNLYGAYNKSLDSLPIPDLGNSSTISLADIDDDGYYEMAVGNERGGIQFFNTEFRVGFSTAVDDITLNEEVNVYPNPTNNFITVQTNGDQQVTTVRAYDMQNKEIFFIENNQEVIDVSRWNSGVYVLKITLDNRQEVIKKVVKF